MDKKDCDKDVNLLTPSLLALHLIESQKSLALYYSIITTCRPSSCLSNGALQNMINEM